MDFAWGAHLPILQVIVVLLAAPLAFLTQRVRVAWLIAFIASAIALWIASCLLIQVQQGGAIVYQLGGWAAPMGIGYHIDLLNAFMLVLVSAISTIALPYSLRSIEEELSAHSQPLFYVYWLLCVAGLLGILATGDAFNVFVFLEISALSTYALIALGSDRDGDRRALHASLKYLLLGSIGATFIVIGIGLLYMMTGTLNMMDLAARLPAVQDTRTVHAAFAFLVIGAGLKAAMFPLHTWLPDAYSHAPSATSVLLAGTSTKVAIYVMLRFLISVFGFEFSFIGIHVELWLLPLAVLAILYGSLRAVYQLDAKRLLAYSSVAQVGYIFLAISIGSAAGIAAGLIHMFNHALMKAALFMAIGAVVYRAGGSRLFHIAGFGRAMPWTFGAMLLGGMSLVGVPFTVGFISKWYLVTSSLDTYGLALVVFVLASSLLAALYVWRLVDVAWFRPVMHERELKEAPLSMLLPMWVLVLANVYFAFDTDLTVGIAQRTAAVLLGGAQ
ncbi:MAG: monovalent cation/H+ antiporter subunit D family protein [Halioglobus sp.]